MGLRNSEDTICALATPAGLGGISVVRVSGSNSKKILSEISNLPESIESHRAYFLNIFCKGKSRLLDEAVVTFFEKGRSYTGDDTFEISCHGSPIIVEQILQNLIESGCRMAERGEFTFRSFMAGKIDLLQAEGVLSLIESETNKAHEIALSHLKGGLSQEIDLIKQKLIRLLAHQEASIDFSLENLETISSEEITEQISNLKNETDKLLGSYRAGKILNESYKVAIVGAPNAGKSSLFNAILNRDKAIVTDVAGTTRDVLEGDIVISGVKVRFFDTAGIHETEDKVEIIGIQKTKEQIKNSDCIFYVVDKEHPEPPEEELFTKNTPVIVLGNKSDIVGTATHEIMEKTINGKSNKNQIVASFDVSARDRSTLSNVFVFLEKKLQESFLESSSIVLKARQYDLLERANSALSRALDLSIQKTSSEFIALELRETLENVFELLGERFDDEIMDKVFNEFCIGK